MCEAQRAKRMSGAVNLEKEKLVVKHSIFESKNESKLPICQILNTKCKDNQFLRKDFDWMLLLIFQFKL
jgi:hypothetical protein